MRKDRVVLSEFYQDHRVLFFCTLLFGLLYIPAFMYGFFWLWIVPFTGVAILFLQAMIHDAIARVAQKGDAAVQAKAMISEFIKMNIVMMALLSLPFVSALWLHHAGYIQVIQQSAMDQELWRFCLWILREQDLFKQTQYAQIQITLSNMFFMYFSTFSIMVFTYRRLRRLSVILLRRESYKFLRKKPSTGNSIKFYAFIFVGFHLIVLSMQLSPVPSIAYSFIMIVFINFLIYLQITYFVLIWSIGKIQGENLTIEE